MTELRLTELEAIQLTMENGYDGKELTLYCWKKNGSLDGKKDKVTGEFKERSMVSFIRKLETIFDNVEVEGKGKKRTYILSGKKEVMTKKRDDRSTGQHDEYIKIMAKHLYNHLLDKLNGRTFTYNKWMIEIGGLNPDIVNKDKMIFDCFDKIYYGADLDDIKKSTMNYFKHRNQRVMGQMTSNLEHNNLIKKIENYGAVTIENKFISITKESYDEWRNGLEKLVTSYDLKMNNYKFFLNREGHEDFTEAYELYIQKTEIEDVYKTYTLYITNKKEPFELSYSEFQKAYNNKLIKEIVKLDYAEKNENYFAHRFRKFNYLTILKKLNWTITIDDELIEQNKPLYEHIYWMIKDRKHQQKMEESYKRLLDATKDFGGDTKVKGDITATEMNSLDDETIDKLLAGEDVTVADSNIKQVDGTDLKSDVTESDNEINVSSLPYTMDDLIDGFELATHFTYIPMDNSDTKQDTHKDTIHNNQALKDAVNSISLAFAEPTVYSVGSF